MEVGCGPTALDRYAVTTRLEVFDMKRVSNITNELEKEAYQTGIYQENETESTWSTTFR
jgi:hypothetical protein